MTNEVQIVLCEHKKEHPSFTQADLITWLQETHNVFVSQGTISLMLKRSAEILAKKEDVNRAAKRQWTMKYPLMETALYQWFLTY
jgi:predicted SAM-dependent methyltransferase